MSAATWEFEAADPEVGFLSDSVTHTCDANLDEAQPATEDSRFANVERRKADGTTETVVAETKTFTCPVCHATTAVTEHWPLWFFEAPGPGGDE